MHRPRRPLCLPQRACRYLPWAANSDPRFTSIPERLHSAPQHQQLRDSDFTLPLPLVRGLFSQGLHMSTCWSSAIRGIAGEMGQRADVIGKAAWRSKAYCAEDDTLYHGFEENGWPKLELRWLMSLLNRSHYDPALTTCKRYSQEKMQKWLRDSGWV